jgi:choline-glycine betaine transporter
MKAKEKVGRLQSDQDKPPYSAIACLLMLLAAGILVKFAAFSPMFHIHLN